MNAHLILLLLPAATLWSSCVTNWNVGQCIRDPQEIHTGVYLHSPEAMQYRVYHAPETTKRRYALAPEVTFRVKRPVLRTEWFGYTPENIVDVTPTGARQLVQVEGGWEYAHAPYKPCTLLEKLPEGATAMEPQDTLYASLCHTRASWARRLAAAPFDYLMDPALTVVSTTVATVGAGIICIPLLIIDPQQVIPCSG